MISKQVLLAPIDELRAEIHEPVSSDQQKRKPTSETLTVVPFSLGSDVLDLAKEALLKHGFSYVCQENDTHYWTSSASKSDSGQVSLWENEGSVWIRSSTPDIGLPTSPTLITDVWDNTGILPPIPSSGLPVSDEMLAVREGKLSPLAIKRAYPVLHKLESEDIKKNYKTHEQNTFEIQRVFDRPERIIGLVAETGAGKTYSAASYVLNGSTISLNASFWTVEEVIRHFQRRNVESLERWRARRFRWDQVKDIPIETRMATPFQHGNMCEDYDRCDALEQKGGDPNESICPQCLVYTECLERGYLSQPEALKRADAQMSGTPFQFFDPKHSEVVEEILEQVADTERLCLMDEVHAHSLFFRCGVPIKTLEEWCVNWEGHTLGNFAQALLNALETKNDPSGNAVRRIRTAVQAFQQYEDELIKQMCQVNVQGRVIDNGFIDAETGEELARWTIEFEGSVFAYIPLDKNAEDKLMEKGLPFLHLHSFVLNEDMKFPMPMAQAIQFGILDITTVQSIQNIPSVCRYPNWTLWHQLKQYLWYYTRDADAPMILHHQVLWFWVPPVLHSSVKRLILMSSTLSEQELHKAFPDEEIEFIHIDSAAWLQGNRVFQIRTGTYPLETILNYYDSWDVVGVSNIGQRFLLGIQAEIERDLNVKHAIITDNLIIKHLADVAAKENVSFVTGFKQLHGLETAFEEAEVIWIVGTPLWEPGIIWRRAQILYGNDQEPLCYERETDPYRYKDARVQSVYEQHVVDLLTNITGRAGLNRTTDKTVVLITSFPIPDITDRPETLLFDWEDFEIAGSLEKLAETIAKREHFETERDNLTAESGREKVEHVLGCSSSKANRILRKLRGGKLLRVPLRDQIFSLLTDGEKKTAELMEAIESHPTSVKNELKRLVDAGEIVKVRRGVYDLP